MAKRTDAPHPNVRHNSCGEFDEGPTYRTYRRGGSGDYLLILTVGGAGRIVHDHGTARCDVGDVWLYAPGAMQNYGTHPDVGQWHLAFAHLHPRPHWQPWLALPQVGGEGQMKFTIHDQVTFERMLDALRDAVRMRSTPVPQAELFAHNALERALLWMDCANPNTGGQPMDQRVADAIDYLRDHMSDAVTIDALAGAVHLSASRLSHLFKEQVGLTPIQYLERQRIERARQLLEHTTLPVQQIAHEVGFESPFYFSLRFKKATGHSPRAYRNAMAAG